MFTYMVSSHNLTLKFSLKLNKTKGHFRVQDKFLNFKWLY